MSKFRVLVIPGRVDQGLDVATEMLELSNIGKDSENLTVEVVPPGRSSEMDIVNLLRVQGQKYDCLHFLGHSDGSTFELASGDVLDEDRILTLCRDAEARVLFMNACSGASLCQYAVNTTMAVALAWVGNVVDRVAILAAIRFYSAIKDMGDPYGSGLRRAYEAAGEKRNLLWLTDGEYVTQIIQPLIARLDAFDRERTESFSRFSSKLETLADQSTATSAGLMNALALIKDQVSVRFVEFSQSHKRLRITLYAALAIIIVIAGMIAYQASAQTVPPTDTPLPGCNASGGQPKKCNTPTDTPIPISPTDTPVPPTPTDTPVQPTSTDTPVPPTPTDTPVPPTPTDTPVPPTPTYTPRPTHTPTDEPTPTYTPRPTNTPRPTPTDELPPCQ